MTELHSTANQVLSDNIPGQPAVERAVHPQFV